MMRFSRRDFLKSAAAMAALVSTTAARPAICRELGSAEKLNVAWVGVGGQARTTLASMTHENFYAMADVCAKNLALSADKYQCGKRFADYRQMLEELEGDIDAVVVSTPDHTHAPASLMAMRMGKHCYCEKPLTHDLAEAREMQKVAAEKKLVTQMGTQPNAWENYRTVVEMISSGVIGNVSEVHVWTGTGNTDGYIQSLGADPKIAIPRGNGWGQPSDQTLPTAEEIPSCLNWDLWVGTAQKCPYNRMYVPGNWRRWWAFGNGQLGDFGCHFMNLPFWCLNLKDPLTVETVGPKVNPFACPEYLKVKYTFAARECQRQIAGVDDANYKIKFPACTLTWYDGNDMSEVQEVLKKHGVDNLGAGILFVGEKGCLLANYTLHKLFPVDNFADYKMPEQFIPRTKSHYIEFTEAIRANDPNKSLCNFAYAGKLTEAVLLGNVTYRAGGKLNWDAANLKSDNDLANALIAPAYREGWNR